MSRGYRCMGCGAESASRSAPCKLCGCKRFVTGPASSRSDAVDVYQNDVRRLRAQLRRLRNRRA